MRNIATKYITAEEAAQALNYSCEWIDKLAARGDLKAYKESGKWRISEASANEYRSHARPRLPEGYMTISEASRRTGYRNFTITTSLWRGRLEGRKIEIGDGIYVWAIKEENLNKWKPSRRPHHNRTLRLVNNIPKGFLPISQVGITYQVACECNRKGIAEAVRLRGVKGTDGVYIDYKNVEQHIPSKTSIPRGYIGDRDAAKIIGVSPDHIREKARRGDFGEIKTVSRRYFLQEKAVHDYIRRTRPKGYIRAARAAKQLDVHRYMISYWVDQGELRGYRDGNSFFISEESLKRKRLEIAS